VLYEKSRRKIGQKIASKLLPPPLQIMTLVFCAVGLKRKDFF
jgi:hypothetical protein